MSDDLGFVCPECKTSIKYAGGMTLGEVLSLRHNSQHQAVKIDVLKMDNNAKGARIAELEAAIDLFIAYDETEDEDGVAMMQRYDAAIEAARKVRGKCT